MHDFLIKYANLFCSCIVIIIDGKEPKRFQTILILSYVIDCLISVAFLQFVLSWKEA